MRSITPSLLLIALAGSAASAQTLWNSAAGGLWGTPANWSPADVPNSSGELARILLPGVYQIDIASSVTVGGVELFNSGTTIAIQPAVQLSIVGGVLANEGTILVNPIGSTTDATLAFNIDTIVSGSGEIRLNGIGLDARIDAQTGATFTNAFPHVIRGRGRLLGMFANQSSIIGDVPGQDLEIAFEVTQSGMGECLADGGNIGLQSGARITGGVMRSLSGGVWRTQTGSSIIDGITNEGDGQVIGGTLLRMMSGGVVNNGTITINPTGTVTDATMDVLESATHSGTGVLRLNGVDLDAQLNSQPGMTLTNEATIAGRGRVAASIINDGLILADVTGQVLTINGPVVQTAGGVCRASEGLLGLSAFGSISGGTLETSGAGRWQSRAGSPDIDGVTNTGMGEVLGGATLEVLAGGLVNNGEIIVNPTASVVNAALNIPFSADLVGDGVIRLNGAAVDAQFNVLGGATLLHGANHEIVGRGRLSGNIEQRGTVRADNPLSALEVSASLNQTSGGQCVGDNGIVGLISGALVTGGTFDSVGTGAIHALVGASTISGVTNLGSLAVAPGAELRIDAGGLVNEGECVVNTIGSSTNAMLVAVASAPISGSGRLALNGVDFDAQFNTLAGAVITHGPAHTIGGRGHLAADIDNAGTIDADVVNGSLIVSGDITQAPGGVIRATAGTLALSSASISGGVIDGTGFGSVGGSIGASTLRDLTLLGSVQVLPGATVSASGVIMNNGTIAINPTLSSTNALFSSTEACRIDGTGEIVLHAAGSDSQLIGFVGEPLVLGPGQTLRGRGLVTGAVELEGTVAPGFSIGDLQAAGTLTFAPSARYDVEIDSAAWYDQIAGGADFNLAGEVRISYPPTYLPGLGHRLVILTGSSVSGRFDLLDAPDLGLYQWKLVYFPNKVELQVRCRSDLTGSSDPNHPEYGIPDGVNDASDFFYYLDLFVAQDSRADLTTSSDPNDPGYGQKDGVIDASDFFFYLDTFVTPCV